MYIEDRCVLLRLNFLIVLIIASATMICVLACSGKTDSVLPTQEPVELRTAIPTYTTNLNLSETPGPSSDRPRSQILTPTSVSSKSETITETPVNSNASVSVDIFKIWDEALANPYTYSSEMEIDIVLKQQGNQEELKVKVDGVSDDLDYDATAFINDTFEMKLLKKGDRSFLMEPSIAEIWRELPDGQTLLNSGELISEVRNHISNVSVVGDTMMGGMSAYHFEGTLDSGHIGSFIGLLLDSSGDLKCDVWIEKSTGRLIRIDATGQAEGPEGSDISFDMDLTLASWNFGSPVEINLPPVPPSVTSMQWDLPPEMGLLENADYKAIIKVYKRGEIVIDLYENEAPVTVNNFVFLAEEGFYDGIIFHRVISDFMAQTGDPTGTGSGGPGYKFGNEFHPDARHDSPGVVSMANSGTPNGQGTNGSQFFITYKDTSFLDGLNADTSPKECSNQGVSCHSVFGKVISGMEVLQSIEPRDPSAGGYADIIESIVIESE